MFHQLDAKTKFNIKIIRIDMRNETDRQN